MATEPGAPLPDAPAGEPNPHARDDAADRAEAELALRIERIGVLSDALRQSRKETRRARQETERLRRELRALRSRRAVRVALAISRRVSRLASVGRRPRAGARRTAASGHAVEPEPSPTGLTAAVAHRDPSRAALLARLRAGPDATTDPIHAITVALAPEAARALREGGWTVTEMEAGAAPSAIGASADVLVTGDHDLDVRAVADGVVRVAWTGPDPSRWLGRPWSDEYDLVLTVDHGKAVSIADATVHTPAVVGSPADDGAGGRMRDRLAAWAALAHIDLAIGPSGWDVAATWGDYHFGRALQRAFVERGYPTRVRLRQDWDGPGAARADAVIHLFGLAERRFRRGQLDVLWAISHPSLLTDAYVAAHDVAFVAGDALATALAERTGLDVRALHQATDTRRFRPVVGGPRHELLFVANSRGARRTIVDELTPTARDLAVFGKNWTDDRLDPRHFRGEYIPNDELPASYAAATIVLNDHWADMIEHGFFSNRLYDAAASGAFVISDHVPGIEEEFDGGIVTFRSGRELRRSVERYLADPDGRATHAAAAMAAVRARHTMGHRADRILETIGPALADRAATTQIGQSR